ncbi:carbohydrate binding domain-containing protein [Elusimicrobiota bacterium]
MKKLLNILIAAFIITAPLNAFAADETGSVSITAFVEDVLDTPNLFLPSIDTDGTYAPLWNVVSSATVYQLQESMNSNFTTVTNYWVSPGNNTQYQFNNKSAGTYYYRLKAWESYPSGLSSAWSTTASIVVLSYSMPAELLDSFNDGPGPNFWGGNYGVMDDNGSLDFSYDDTNYYGASGYAIAMDYDVSGSGDWSGIFVELNENAAPVNIAGYKTLKFRVKGSVSDIPVKIGLENSSGGDRTAAHLYINDYLDGGVTTSWQQVEIPLAAFANLDSFANAKVIVFVFENAYAVSSGFNTSGILYIDDLEFGDTAPNELRIDHFGDNWGWLAVGGNIGDLIDNGAHNTTFNTSIYNEYSRSMRSQYDVSSDGNWSGLYMVFGGGNNGWTAQSSNFSDYRYLTFQARVGSSSTNPVKFKVEIMDHDSTHQVVIPDNTTTPGSNLSTSWQEYRIDMNTIGGLNKGTIKQINVIYEYWRINGAGGDLSGTVYFDEIQFEKE